MKETVITTPPVRTSDVGFRGPNTTQGINNIDAPFRFFNPDNSPSNSNDSCNDCDCDGCDIPFCSC